MLQRGLSPPPLPWSVSTIIMQSSQHSTHALRLLSIRSLDSSSQVCNSVWPQQSRLTVDPFFLAGLLQPQYSLGSSLRVSLTSVVSADCRARLEAPSIFSPQ